jgi:hypothetical protein
VSSTGVSLLPGTAGTPIRRRISALAKDKRQQIAPAQSSAWPVARDSVV